MAVSENLRNLFRKNALMRSVMKSIRKSGIYRRLTRRQIVNSYLQRQNMLGRNWVGKRTERSNFYYELTEMNRKDLQSLVSVITGVPRETLKFYLNELLEDRSLYKHLEAHLKSKIDTRDSTVAFGRREGWYLFIRALKPKLVVETGVHHGVGACLIAAALLRNKEEGFEGSYLGTEIDRNAGSLFTGKYASVGEVRYGDSIETLSKLESKIDIFINDSDHSGEYEMSEYATVGDKMTENSVILGDNSHVTSSLRDFAEQNQRPFIFFKELPHNHWYPGGGIGISPSQIPLVTQ